MLPAAEAQSTAYDAPESLVASVVSPFQSGDAWSGFANLTFPRSADDPGDWRYFVHATNGSFSETSIHTMGGSPALLGNLRPGWVGVLRGYSGEGEASNSTFTFKVAAVDPDSALGIYSCAVTVDLRQPALPFSKRFFWEHDQCGRNLTAPSGVAAYVGGVASSRGGHGVIQLGPSNVTVDWPLSSDDEDQENGSFDYWVYEHEQTEAGARRITNDTLGNPCDADGARCFDRANIKDVPLLRVWVVAVDNRTAQRSNLSCVTAVDTGVLHQRRNCGSFETVKPTVDGAPAFPFLDVAATASALGMPTSAFGYILGGIVILGVLISGFMVAGPAGGVAGGVLGFGLAIALNLLGRWVLIFVFFLLVASIVVFKGRGGNNE